MIALGQKVRDTVTGFVGTAIARTEWLYGCIRIGVAANELRDGKPIEEQWFDEARLEEPLDTPADRVTGTGGPGRPTAPNRDPAR